MTNKRLSEIKKVAKGTAEWDLVKNRVEPTKVARKDADKLEDVQLNVDDWIGGTFDLTVSKDEDQRMCANVLGMEAGWKYLKLIPVLHDTLVNILFYLHDDKKLAPQLKKLNRIAHKFDVSLGDGGAVQRVLVDNKVPAYDPE